MSWRDQMQDGSFRGVPFLLDEECTTQIGRRGQLHEYPLCDTPYGEDLGRRARSFAVDCLVLGDDYMAARDALIVALETKGAGTLVHPYYGTMSVVVFDAVEVRESTRAGGMARFRIPFRESGEKLNPASTTDTPSVVNTQAASTQAQLASSFANGQYAVSGLPSWLGASALGDIGSFTQQLQSLAAGISTVPAGVTAFNGLLQGFSSAVTSLIEAPFDLAAGVVSLVVGIGTMVQQPLDALSLYQSLASWGDTLPTIAGTTPASAQAASNRGALVTLVQGLGLAQACAASAAVPAQTQTALVSAASSTSTAPSVIDPTTGVAPPSLPTLVSPQDAAQALLSASTVTEGYDTAQAAATLRDTLTDAIDTVCLTADDPTYQQWRDLRAAIVADLSTRAATLPSLVTFVPTRTLPALVIAYRLYGDATRAEEIVARNDLEYPGFVAGGQPLEVLSV